MPPPGKGVRFLGLNRELNYIIIDRPSTSQGILRNKNVCFIAKRVRADRCTVVLASNVLGVVFHLRLKKEMK